MGIAELNGDVLEKLVEAAASHLEEKKAAVDALNVFPVPDGDTGTNMYLTIRSAVREIQQQSGGSVGKVVEAASMGSLMGARGNSGVILSQLLRGFARSLEGKQTLNAVELAAAIQAGVDTAYKAVMKPVEGTILTVSKGMARGASMAARQGSDILGTLRAALLEGEKTLEKTPDMLPVLKQAGVVDAGGKGLLLLLEGAVNWLQQQEGAGTIRKADERMAVPLAVEFGGPAVEPETAGQMNPVDEPVALDYLYCTEFLIKGDNIPLEAVRKELEDLGDCLLVVGEEGIRKVHIHTNHPGRVLEKCLTYGTLHRIQINNMLDQHRESELRVVPDDAGSQNDGSWPEETVAAGDAELPNPEALPATGIVAVAPGDGLKEILESLGVDVVIPGGQTMNPSTEEVVSAITKVTANRVFVLPNNKNITMAAKQAGGLVDKQVEVIPSHNVAQGIAALLAYDPEQDFDVNTGRMKEALKRVKCGEVTFAVRDSCLGDAEISEGDILGLSNGEIKSIGRDLDDVVLRLLEELIVPEDSLITLYYGENLKETEAQALVAKAQERFPDMEIEMHYGGQPLYFYLISVE